MNENRKRQAPEDVLDEAPKRVKRNWDEVRGVQTIPEDEAAENVPFDQSGRVDTDEHYGEGQDNPYMESDSALPDDEEEDVLKRNNSREGGRFDEV